ncbi:MAG: ATP-binding cassette domain-containing protein, partial [Bryobacteraceae bacterium]
MFVDSSPPALLDFRNVSVMRDAHVALCGISLRIQPGEHAAILGPNGCGKSTLIKTIARECYPLVEDGSALSILGRDRWNIFELRAMLGIVSADLTAACAREITGEEAVI